MKSYELKRLDLQLYYEKLKNGLEVYIIPKENVNGIYATLSTKFGSIYAEFVPNGKKKMIKVPLGVAHFLEHKVFEQEDEKDPFTFYSERGCDANANTSNYKTTYLFSGSNSLIENINFLLDYVQSPYFTDENVEKEKGIIEQEIKMYDDEPYFKLYNGIIYNAFVNHPIKYPIAGTVKDVYSITKEDLYTCYNTFYNPANMFLVVSGNVDPEELIKTVKLNQENKKFNKFSNIKLKQYDEPNKVEKEKEEITMDIEISKLGVAYKIDCSKFNKDIIDIKAYLNILLDLKLGSTSIFNEKLKNLNLISSDIEFSLVHTDKHILIIILIESDNTDEVIKLLNDELNNLKIEKEELERKKKVKKSAAIYRSDNIYAMNNRVVSNIINHGKVILDEYKKIDEFNMRTMNTIINKLDLSNKTVYIIKKS